MKRGESGLSLLVAVDKPVGMSSHDVVNRCRRVFGERRVGHTGTLDPMASGVLPICVGPATRLDQYMTGHDKRYRVDIAFGCETTTDDVEGMPTVRGSLKPELMDDRFARAFLLEALGEHDQVPPRYSAVKVNGKKAYQVARAGKGVDLEPRRIEVYEAQLVDCRLDGTTGFAVWSVDFSVSKGTYIRALARDIGRAIGCPAHVGALRRTSAGSITLADCVSLDTLQALGVEAALDPVSVLGYRYAFGDDMAKAVTAGSKLSAGSVVLYNPLCGTHVDRACSCTSRVTPSSLQPSDGEIVAIVLDNRLKSLYAYSEGEQVWKPACVFSTSIARG